MDALDSKFSSDSDGNEMKDHVPAVEDGDHSRNER